MTRIAVLKTYKLYIGGQFPRTESGRYYTPTNRNGDELGSICLASRKDVRNAVVAARKAFGPWSARAAFNRSQILYRIAEMLEGRSAQFVEEIKKQGSSETEALSEVEKSIDRLVYYAGWCDKYQQVIGSVNPVASSHFNFSVPEPTGVVGICADENTALLGLVSLLAPVIAGGNTAVVLASESKPLSAITFAEVLNSSDVPGGVVNILTGDRSETLKTLASHMDVNAIAYDGEDESLIKLIGKESVSNLKRTHFYKENWSESATQGLHYISAFQEIKTTWHPIENIGGSGSGY